jgi:hypothetical protein
MSLLPSRPAGAQALESHLHLDWQAPRRWVHIDNVDPEKIRGFEDARHDWLKALRRGDRLLSDGRPLFWCARSGDKRTYFTFYPFRNWADLDARAAMVEATSKIVGDSTVAKYDSGDSTLIPPHCSQIWRRLNGSDIVGLNDSSLTEITAAIGRLEIHQIDWWHWDEFEKLWKDVQSILVANKYPLVCRVYTNAFGNNQGEYVLFWMAADSVQYNSAPPLRTILTAAIGKEKCDSLIAGLESYFPMQQSYEMLRRPDLSNLGK